MKKTIIPLFALLLLMQCKKEAEHEVPITTDPEKEYIHTIFDPPMMIGINDSDFSYDTLIEVPMDVDNDLIKDFYFSIDEKLKLFQDQYMLPFRAVKLESMKGRNNHFKLPYKYHEEGQWVTDSTFGSDPLYARHWFLIMNSRPTFYSYDPNGGVKYIPFRLYRGGLPRDEANYHHGWIELTIVNAHDFYTPRVRIYVHSIYYHKVPNTDIKIFSSLKGN